MPPGFSGNLIFAIIARMLCGNHLNFDLFEFSAAILRKGLFEFNRLKYNLTSVIEGRFLSS